MEVPDWQPTKLPNMTFYDQIYDQQQHSCENFIPSSPNYCNPESNFLTSPTVADFSNPGGLDQVFPMQSPPNLFTIDHNDNSSLSSWQNQDLGTPNPFFYLPGEATPENPLFHTLGEATWENPENPMFSVSNCMSQSDLTVNYSQPEPLQFTNFIQSSENCLAFATDTSEEYAISSEHEKLVKSMWHSVNHSLEASEAEFNDIVCIENVLEETLPQISGETNPDGGSIVTSVIKDHSGIMNISAGSHRTHDDLPVEFLNQEVDFHHVVENPHLDLRNPRLEKATQHSMTDFLEPSSSRNAAMEEYSQDETMISPMKEMIYRAAAMKPVNLDREVVDEKDQKPKRKNVRISSDPQTVAARQRRERISERLKVLKKLVPGGGKLDTASLLEEVANYLKFLKAQIEALENLGRKFDNPLTCIPMNLMFPPPPFYHSFPMGNNISLYQLQNHTHHFHQPQD